MSEDAVIREVLEETDIVVDRPRLVGQLSGYFTQTWQDKSKLRHVQSILPYYLYDFVGGKLSTDGFMEHERLFGEMSDWMPLGELDKVSAGSIIDWRSVVRAATNSAP